MTKSLKSGIMNNMTVINSIVFTLLLLTQDVNAYPRYSSDNVNDEPKLFFIMPSNGQVLTSPIKVRFGIRGMEIVPAGVDKPMSGHHHLLINVDKLPNMEMPIPADGNHIHFGKGETETTLVLPKGKHELQLLLGNHIHVPHKNPLISEKIEIFIE